jgi:3-hydroxy acid dehydrogenase/malonic semialdehyde reductase
MKIVLVTGATSGFGRAIARKFAAENYKVIITGRRADRLNELASELISEGAEVKTLAFDVRNFEETQNALHSLPSEWQAVDVLINNAGLAVGRDPVHEGALDDWNRMIDTNIKGVLHVSKVVVPWLIARKSGMVINIGSIAGREAYPGGNVYGATKFAVEGLTRSMRIDLVSHGIRVGQIAPGAAETEFSIVRFHGDKDKADKVYDGFKPLQAEDIADAAWFMASRPAHVNIQDILIMPTAQASASVIHKI